jgi:hypothetical protein
VTGGRALLVLGVLLGSAAAVRAESAAKLPALDPSIRTVVSGGMWERAAVVGTFRIVVQNLGWEHTRSLVQVQWLAPDDATQKLRIAATVAVPELNEATWANVDSIRFLPGPGSRVDILYVVHGERPQLRMVLALGTPGSYTVEKP